MISKTDLAKRAASFIVGIGTAKIVSGIIDNNTTSETVTDKVTITTAGLVIGIMAADKTKLYTDNFIDELIAGWKNNVRK